MGQLLLVDDEPDLILAQVDHVFGASPHRIDVARTGQEGIRRVIERAPDVILLDLRLPDLSGLDVYRRIRQIDARIPVVFITAAPTAHYAIEAMKEGAYDYLIKPLDTQHLRRVVGQALELSRLIREPAVVAESPPEEERGDAIIGCCPSMLEVFKAIGRVAAQDVTVLITGESGTGKELVARAIYQHGARAKEPFLAINCAAIPENLLESELFGHEKGSFTGAERRRIGKFEQCSGGTLFLDEVGDMPLATQGKVLRLLQDQAFERVGGNETIQTDVRLIAATNHDLGEAAAHGKYRPDLYYRLSVFTIHLPPLRERGNDLPMLVRHYVRRFNRELGREVREVTPEAMDLLRSYSWPGSIRELQSVLKQTLLRVTTGPKPSRRWAAAEGRRSSRSSARSCRAAAQLSTRTSTARSTSSSCRWCSNPRAATSSGRLSSSGSPVAPSASGFVNWAFRSTRRPRRRRATMLIESASAYRLFL